MTDKQIEQTVIVAIEPDGAGEQARLIEARCFGHIRKGTVAIVVIENQPPIGCYQKIDPSVSVVVCGGNSEAEIPSRHACLFRHISKGAVTIIAIQSIAQRLCGLKEIARTAIYKIEIHPAVVIVVEDCDSGSHGLRQVAAG